MNIEKAIIASKNLVRTGWMQNGIPPSMGETVASHSFEAAVLAYLISLELKKKGIDINPERASVIALFHDLGESLLGDLPKWASDRIKSKNEIEREAIKELGLPLDLFDEYESRKTNEGLVAKFCDILSTYLQAIRYKKLGFKVDSIIETYEREIELSINTFPLSTIKEFIHTLINEYK